MDIFNVIKYDANFTEFVWKYPTEDLRLGSQLIVRPGQAAFFVKGGKIYDEFINGTYTIKSNNIPLLNKIINIPFGNTSPFQAEVWFINTLTKLDNKWGTPIAMLLEDPDFNIVVPVRAFGQYGISISNARLFFESLIGTLKSFTNQDITSYFNGIMITRVSDSIAEKLVLDKISVLKIPAYIQDISEFVTEHLKGQFDKYGIDLVNFSIMSINMPEDDSSVLALKAATEKRMHIKTVGKDIYTFDRSMDVMEKAASNEGTGGDLMGAAMGLGMGFAIGPKMGNQMGQIGQQMNTNVSDPPPIPTQQYYAYQNGQQFGPFTIEILHSNIQQKIITTETFIWKPGMANWENAGSIPELTALFNSVNPTPPPPPPPPEKKD
jgi:membrane protease subunit (stomatin/prohibitin family)